MTMVSRHWLSFSMAVALLWVSNAAHVFAQSEAQPSDGLSLGERFNCDTILPESQAAHWFNRVQETYRTVRSLSASFVQESVVVSLDQSEQASGIVQYLRPGRMKWTYRSPEPQVFLVRDNAVWLYQEAHNQVIVDDLTQVVLSDVPVAFLMGIGELGAQFEVSQVCDQGNTILLELLPRASSDHTGNGGSTLQRFDLLVDAKNAVPVGARVVDVGGNTTTIALEALERNTNSISEGLFAAQFPAGTDIADRRASSRKAGPSALESQGELESQVDSAGGAS